MKIGLIILCRYSSSRLPGKILASILDRMMIEHIVDRLRYVTNAHEIIVATSTDVTDDLIVEKATLMGLKVYRGSLENVAERFLDAAKYFKLDYVVRINGDNLFIEHNIIQEMISIALNYKYDFVSNAIQRTFPIGMSVEVINVRFYESVFRQFTTEEHFEHVTKWVYQNENVGTRFSFLNTIEPKAAGLQLAIDTNEDLEMAERVLEAIENFNADIGLKEIFNAYQKCCHGVYS